MPQGHFFAAAEKREVNVLEGIRADGLDERDLVTHLVQLAQTFVFIEQNETRRGKA